VSYFGGVLSGWVTGRWQVISQMAVRLRARRGSVSTRHARLGPSNQLTKGTQRSIAPFVGSSYRSTSPVTSASCSALEVGGSTSTVTSCCLKRSEL
jgi:hypothetical protein